MDGGAALRRARLRAGLTQDEVARRAGVPQPAVARIERGRVTPRVDTLDRLLEACGYALVSEPRLGSGVDRTQIRALLAMSPAERLRRAAADANALRRLETAVTRRRRRPTRT